MVKVNMVPGWAKQHFLYAIFAHISTFTRTRITHKLHARDVTHLYGSGIRDITTPRLVITDHMCCVLVSEVVFISR